MKRFFIVLVVALLAVAAACNQSKNQADVLQTGLNSIHAPIDTLVLSPQLSQDARQAAASLYPVVDASAIHPANGWDFPSRHFLLKAVSINGDSAHVVGMLGPVPSPRPNFGLLACGSSVDITLQRNSSGGWQVTQTNETVC